MTAWPFAGRAQQKAMPVIGFCSISANRSVLTAFRAGSAETGCIEVKT
jgi:hypothetical protein